MSESSEEWIDVKMAGIRWEVRDVMTDVADGPWLGGDFCELGIGSAKGAPGVRKGFLE